MLFSDRRTVLPAILLLTMLAAVVAISTSSIASTDVDSNITVSTEWDTAGSPYFIKTNVFIKDGVTLTIDKGVDVRFVGSFFIEAEASGKMVAQGTEDEPINFTSSAAEPAVGDWQHLSTGSGGSIEFAFIKHATLAVFVEDGGTVSNCDVRFCTEGIGLRGAGCTVQDTTVFGLTGGIGLIDASNGKVLRCQVELCAEGINFLGATRDSIVDNCTVNSSGTHAIGIYADGGNNKVWNCQLALSPIGIVISDLMAPTAAGNIHLFNNTITSFSDKGIDMEGVDPSNPVKIQRCRFLEGNIGLYAFESGNFEVTECTFKGDIKGAKLVNCTGYTAYIHKNNFIIFKNEPGIEAETTNSESYWDYLGFGNYWHRALDQYGFFDDNGDGIAEQDWSFTGTQKDFNPLMKPIDFEEPVADAGGDLVVKQRVYFDLDGSGSTDDTWIVNHTWTVDLPGEDVVAWGVKPRINIGVAGVFIVTLSARDPLGKIDIDTLVINVTDADAPTFVTINTPNIAGAGDNFTFSANITDNVAVAKVTVRYRFGLAGSETVIELEHKGNDVWEKDIYVPASVQQKLYYRITARDARNNLRHSSEREVVVADISPPEMIPTLGANVTTGDFNWINVTITDNRLVKSATVEYWFGEDGTRSMLNMSMMGTLWVTEIDVPRDAQSPLNLIFNATDPTGNWAVTEVIQIPVVDNDPPVVNIDLTLDKFHKGEQAEVRAIINDNMGIESAFIEVRYPPDITSEAYPLTFDGTEWVGMVTVKSSGVRIHYHFRVTDTTGNVIVTDDTERLLLSQRPTIVTVPTAEAWEGQEYSVDFQAEDPDNEDYEFKWDMISNASWLIIDQVDGVVSGTPGDVHVGWFWVNVTVQDLDGVEDWLYYEIVVHDVNAPPEVSIVSPADEQKVGTILRVSGRAEDDLGQIDWVQVRIDEGEWENVTGTKTWSYEVSVKKMKPGMHFIHAKSFDGLSESKVIEIAFIVPKRDDEKDSPGFGVLISMVAIAAAIMAVTIARGRRL